MLTIEKEASMIKETGGVTGMKRSIGVIGVLALGIFGLLWYNGIIVFDHSAKVHVEGMEWNGKHYSEIAGVYTEGKTIAKSEDGGWNIKEVKEDPSHTFVVVRSFFDDRLYVAEDYVIPESGKLTSVAVDGELVTDDAFLQAMAKLDSQKVTSFEYVTENIWSNSDTHELESIYVAYEGCPVATIYKGLFGQVNGKWIITTYIETVQEDEESWPTEYKIGCYEIPEKYVDVISKYNLDKYNAFEVE